MSVRFPTSGWTGEQAVLHFCKTESPAFTELLKCQESGDGQFTAKAKEYLDGLAEKTYRVGSVTFSEARVRDGANGVKNIPVRISQQSNVPDMLCVSPPDKGVVDFYLFNTPENDVSHIQLDPEKDREFQMCPRKSHLMDFEPAAVERLKDRPWNNSFVVNYGHAFIAYPFTGETPPVPASKDVAQRSITLLERHD